MDSRREDHETPSEMQLPVTDQAETSLDGNHNTPVYQPTYEFPANEGHIAAEGEYQPGSMVDEAFIGGEDGAEAGPGAGEIAKAVVREVVETVILTLIIFFLIQLVIRNFRVDGHSMDPNLHHGQYLVVDKISYRLPMGLRPPRRGDVIVFAPPTQPDKDFVKRIIAGPGEIVEIRQGQVFVNGEMLDEAYLPRLDRYSMSPRKVPDGEYFVMGDNRGNSNDSRNWGTLVADRIVGKAWVSYWPPQTWGVIPTDGPTDNSTLFHFLSGLIPSAATP